MLQKINERVELNFEIFEKYLYTLLKVKHTMCPRGSDPFYVVTHYIKGSWTDGTHKFVFVS